MGIAENHRLSCRLLSNRILEQGIYSGLADSGENLTSIPVGYFFNHNLRVEAIF